MKNLVFVQSIFVALFLVAPKALGQSETYYPLGDPGQWNVAVTPYVWVPWASGQIESAYLSRDFNVPASDILSNLEGAFMVNAEVSKGKFFAETNYLYTSLAAEPVVSASEGGNVSITVSPELKMNVAGLILGMRFRISETLDVDPYIGFRYNHISTKFDLEGVSFGTSVSETNEFWDPLLGFRVHYFLHPKWYLMLKTDIGGVGVGSDFSWTGTLNLGYTLSPRLDLMAGFSGYGTDFSKENRAGNTTGLNTNMYGFNLGMKLLFPKRFRDPNLFGKP